MRSRVQIPYAPPGANLVYDKDLDITESFIEKKDLYGHDSVVITSHKKIGQRDKLHRIFGQKVTVPTFEVFSNPTINISDVKSRRFNLIDRYEVNPHDSVIITSRGKMGRRSAVKINNILSKAIHTARNDIMAQEDAEIFKILDDIAKVETI